MKDKKSLGDRMKEYEKEHKHLLPNNSHNIIRLDGRGFSKYTKQFDRPFDDIFIQCMDYAATELCSKVQGAKIAYVQSDEISLYFTDTDSEETQLFFNGNVQKINSICASIVSNTFNKKLLSYSLDIDNFKFAEFDCRVITLPNIVEVHNCLLWRQNDNKRNSISQVAQYHFSHKELFKKSTKDMLNMLKGVDDWNNYPENQKMGRIIEKHTLDNNRTKWLVEPSKDMKTEDYLNCL